MKLNNIEKAVKKGINIKDGKFGYWFFTFFEKTYISNEKDKESAIIDICLQIEKRHKNES